MDAFFLNQLFSQHQSSKNFPASSQIKGFLHDLLGVLFPAFSVKEYSSLQGIEIKIIDLRNDLASMLSYFLKDENTLSKQISDDFFKELPSVYENIKKDVKAMFDGDPAAKSENEIIFSYPGFYAIASYRIAHLLLSLEVETLPRIITEIAHGKTGIDIHPGAKIGHNFCIDHGTGVVIGETSTIGNHVKLYQGVTLGALSVEKKFANKKRHPTLEDGVVVYAGATILGGETVIGENSIIGGNVWVVKSVPKNSKIYYQQEHT
jgi:serine O-acetyltransferase